MRYDKNLRVRYSETDAAGTMRPEAIINIFQDMAIYHDHDVGFGVEYWKERHKGWVVNSWDIVFWRMPHLCEELVAMTQGHDARKVTCHRNCMLTGVDGEIYVAADSRWCLMDMEKMTPTLLDDKTVGAYETVEGLDVEEVADGIVTRLPMPGEDGYAEAVAHCVKPQKKFKKLKPIRIPEDAEVRESFDVTRHHLDSNNHVNNGQFAQMVLEYVPEGFVVRRLQIEYLKQAVLGDVIVPRVVLEGDSVCVGLFDEKGDFFVRACIK